LHLARSQGIDVIEDVFASDASTGSGSSDALHVQSVLGHQATHDR